MINEDCLHSIYFDDFLKSESSLPNFSTNVNFCISTNLPTFNQDSVYVEDFSFANRPSASKCIPIANGHLCSDPASSPKNNNSAVSRIGSESLHSPVKSLSTFPGKTVRQSSPNSLLDMKSNSDRKDQSNEHKEEAQDQR